MELYQLIYQSQSLVPFEPLQLSAMLDRSRAYNKRHSITGILLYTPDGRFLQVLEGPRQAVRHLYSNLIITDPRHYNCQVISEGPSLSRSFTGLTMAFQAAQPRDLRKILSPVPPDNPALLIPRPRTRPELLALLLDFVANPESQTSRGSEAYRGQPSA